MAILNKPVDYFQMLVEATEQSCKAAEKLEELLYYLDEPVVGPGALSQFELCRLIKENNITVVLGGQGGDEIFGGYLKYFYGYLMDNFSFLGLKKVNPVVFMKYFLREKFEFVALFNCLLHLRESS